MKRNILRISTALACMILAFNAGAQTNDGRPVWLVVHACNSEQCLVDALEDGANGIELDVHSDAANQNIDWSVNHGSKTEKYLSPDVRTYRNRSEGREGKTTRYVSLKEYLQFADMNRIAFLWLDIKTNEYATALVEHVHAVLAERYGVDEAGQAKAPFSILYGLYDQKFLTVKVKDPKGGEIPALEWYKKYLWANEGIGLAREGSTRLKYATATLTDLKAIYDQYNFPIGKHVMTNGYGYPYFPCFFWNSQISNTLIEAKELKNKGEYCVRTGTWTMEQPRHGLQMIVAKSDTRRSYWSECDLVLIEGRNEFFPAKAGLPGFNRNSTRDFVKWFFRTDGCWWSYNNGHYRLAGQRDKDPFYK